MAVMWPRAIPPEVARNPLRRAECQVYEKLKSDLDDRFVVFYSRPWLGLKPDGEEIDGECDFVVAHPDLGYLAIEVKGGTIIYDPRTEEWKSRDAQGFEHIIKNPVQQARSSKHEILKKLQASSIWKNRWVTIRHGIIFPACAPAKRDLSADMPLRIFCFSDQFERGLAQWALSRFGETEEGHAPVPSGLGIDGIEALEDFLARPFTLTELLGPRLRHEDKEIRYLTEQQFHILEMISDIPRAAISGAAGTGKTIMAREEAVRQSDARRRTLFTCFNRPLASWMRKNTKQSQNLIILDFHELCSALCRQSGIDIPAVSDKNRLFAEVMPECAMKAIDRNPALRFDVAVVDEGQDFIPLWWPAIDHMLKANGLLRIFFDSNQKVYGIAPSLPRETQTVPLRLNKNLRNTRRIWQKAETHYNGSPVIASGPEGCDVEMIEQPHSKKLDDVVNETIGRLLKNEKVECQDLAVLGATDRTLDPIRRRLEIKRINYCPADDVQDDSIIVDTVRRFKGLESQVVIVIVTAELLGQEELEYVALTRPKGHLIVLGSKEHLQQLGQSNK